jgi:Cu/Ag efflux protein CusF
MRKILIPAFAAIIAASTVAYAAASTDTGVIQSIDTKAKTVTLADGKVFSLAKSIKLSKLKVGENVTVTFETKGDKNTASKIVETKA